MKRLILHPNLRGQIQEEAHAAYPRECCGLLEGIRSGEDILTTRLHPTRNIARQTERFEIDPGAHFAILRSVRANGTEVVGCYHSHPNGRTMPSACDLANVGEDGFVWLICGLAELSEGTIAVFVASAGGLVPISCVSETS